MIRKLEKEDLTALAEFNARVYPQRRGIEASFDYRWFRNPFFKELQSVIALDKDDAIFGQLLLMPAECRYQGKVEAAAWSLDFIVENNKRGGIAGALLYKRAAGHQVNFGLGLAEMTSKISSALKVGKIGELHKYFRFESLAALLKYFLRINRNFWQKAPLSTVEIKGNRFKRLNEVFDLDFPTDYWADKNTLEFSRSKDFLSWRFFQGEKSYLFYKLENDHKDKAPAYFVLRPIMWNGIPSFLVVDYRYSSTRDYRLILKAIRKITRQQNRVFTIMGCSEPHAQKVLARRAYFKYGRSLSIVSTKESLEELESILVTFADSDADSFFKE